MNQTSRRILISGAGIGGLCAAIGLRKLGWDVQVFEQAAQFKRVGAAINLTPNSVKALTGLGLREQIDRITYRPAYRVSRSWDTGEETSRLELRDSAQAKYGAPLLTTHRADLLTVLETSLPDSVVHLGRRIVNVTQDDACVTATFEDGGTETGCALIAADGIHSTVRSILFGDEARFTGTVAYRCMVPAERLANHDLKSFTKWWGPHSQSQIVTFSIKEAAEFFVFATVAERDWKNESWSAMGDKTRMLEAFKDYHPEALDILQACGEPHKTALYERDPLQTWTEGRITLLGDACHPMMPYMAQGAGMSIEDSVMLMRSLAGAAPADIPAALARYERARISRASKIQLASRENEFLRSGIDADWVFGYDVTTAPMTN